MGKSHVHSLRQRIEALEEQLLGEQSPAVWTFQRTEDGNWRPAPGCNPGPVILLSSAKALDPDLFPERPPCVMAQNRE